MSHQVISHMLGYHVLPYAQMISNSNFNKIYRILRRLTKRRSNTVTLYWNKNTNLAAPG